MLIGYNPDCSEDVLVNMLSNEKSQTLKLTEDVTLFNYGGDKTTSTLNSKKLTIKGNGQTRISTPREIEGVTIEGTETIPVKKQQLVGSKFTYEGFDGAVINKGGKVSLTNVNLIGNETENNGSGIRNLSYEAINTKTGLPYDAYGSVSLKGTKKSYVQVMSNFATENGGAIYNEGTLTLKYVQFGKYPDLDGINYSNIAARGGAIYNASIPKSKASISNTNFVNNEAIFEGGALYTIGYLKSTSNKYESNEAVNGGAVYVDAIPEKTSAVSISKDSYLKNTAEQGGALYVSNGTVSVSKANFGTATQEDNGNNATLGGAIYNKEQTKEESLTKITSSKFAWNNAEQGGAIYNDGTMTLSKNSIGLKDKAKNEYGNYAIEGGALYNAGSLTDSKTSFSYNKAEESGGALYNAGTILTYDKKGNINGGLKSSKFTKNTSKQGGALFNAGEIGLSKVTFALNESLKGGAFYNDASGIATIISSTFTQNNAVNGGAIYNVGTMNLNKSTVGKSNKKYTYANTGIYGSAIYNEGLLTTTGSKIYYNQAKDITDEYAGYGAIYNAENGKLNLLSTTLTGNDSRLGGGLYNLGTTKTDNKTKFTSNTAVNGGGIYNKSE